MPFLALSSLERETLGLCYRVEAIAIREVLAAVLALEFLRDTDCEEPARWEEALTRFQASWVRVPLLVLPASATALSRLHPQQPPVRGGTRAPD